MHDQLLIVVQRDWRESLKKGGKALPKSEDDAERQLFAFAAGDKLASTHAKPSAAELSLIRGATKGHLAETELLAHLAGFMVVFESTPPAGPKGILGIAMAPALEQLRGAAQHGWHRGERAHQGRGQGQDRHVLQVPGGRQEASAARLAPVPARAHHGHVAGAGHR